MSHLERSEPDELEVLAYFRAVGAHRYFEIICDTEAEIAEKLTKPGSHAESFIARIVLGQTLDDVATITDHVLADDSLNDPSLSWDYHRQMLEVERQLIQDGMMIEGFYTEASTISMK